MLRAIIATLLLLVGVLLTAPAPKVPVATAVPVAPEATLIDGDRMVAEIAAELGDDDNGESAAFVEGPLPLAPAVEPPPSPQRHIVWPLNDRRLRAHDSRPLLPPPRLSA